MLNLHFAPSLDLLVAHVAKELRMNWHDPFAAPEIIVPSPALGKWLLMRLADGGVVNGDGVAPFGCIANVKLLTIEKFLWSRLAPGDAVMLDKLSLQQVLCALLTEERLEEEVFAPVRSYLYGKEGVDPIKKVQLAARIAHQFLEYEYNRPGVWRQGGRWDPQGIDGTWMQGKRYTNDSSNEPWQAELYRQTRRAITGANDAAAGAGVVYLSLPQLYRLRREETIGESPFVHGEGERVILFGVTNMSHFHRNSFVEFSQVGGVELSVYLTNPCAEFWEDVNTSRKSIRREWTSTTVGTEAAIVPRTTGDYNKEELRLFELGAPPADQKLLELWGSAGKENIFLWCQDALWNFEYYSPADIEGGEPPESLLQSLQLSLLRRENKMRAPATGWTPDGSLVVAACPDRGREIEEIREQILDMVHDGTVGLLNEVVVYLSNPALYLPYIQRVFGCYLPTDVQYIPFCILGLSGRETLFAQGVHTLFEIMQGKFDRAHVFELLRNPLVQDARKLPPEQVSIWEGWAEELNIFRGYNREQRARMGDTGRALTDAHSFEYAMARLLVADLTSNAVTLDFVEQEADNDTLHLLPVLPFRNYETSDRSQVELFCATIEGLQIDSQQMVAAINTNITDAIDRLRDLVRAWFGLTPEIQGADLAIEGSVMRAFYDRVAMIALQQEVVGRETVPIQEFIMLALECLQEEPVSGAHAWSGGITFAPLRPSMIVPHAVVFAAGLDDVQFPGSSERPSWDLLSAKRIVGDSDKVRDNRFAFLELIHAARKRLILSYRAKDMQKESELHPSSVVQELAAYLENVDGVPPGVSIEKEIPWIVHESLDVIAAAGRRHGTWNPTDGAVAKLARKERVTSRYNLDNKARVASKTTDSLKIDVRDLRLFLKNPLEYHLSRTLGIELDESIDMMSMTDEPLSSGALAITGMQKAICTTLLRHMFPADAPAIRKGSTELAGIASAELERLYALHTASGAAPEAMLEEMELEFLRQWAIACSELVVPLYEQFTHHYLLENSDLSLGRYGEEGTLPVVMENGAECTVSCRHLLILMPRGSDGVHYVGILAYKKEGAAADNPDLWCEGAVQWLFEEKRSGNGFPLALVEINYGDVTVTMAKLTNERTHAARMFKWLQGILIDMASNCSDHFPLRGVQKILSKKKGDARTWVERLTLLTKSDLEEKMRGDYGYHSFLPAFDLVDARLPDVSDDDLRKLADARFAPILDTWLIGDGGEE